MKEMMVEQDLVLRVVHEQVGIKLKRQEQVGRWRIYEEYKDAGAEWMGEIPAHWEVKRLKFLCTVNPSKAETHSLAKETIVSFLPMELIGEDGQLSLTEQREIHQVQQGYSYFRTGDVIVAKITPCFENGKGALCEQLVNTIGFGTTELHTIRPGRYLDALFLFYATRSAPFRYLGAAHMVGSAGQQRVPEEFIKDFPLAQPPIEEQQTIVTTIDHEITRINTLIAKKEQHVALLQERRRAIINQAVTKGLNAGVAMKDSGVEWLGTIPEHWEICKLKYDARFFSGGTPSKANANYWSGEIPWISPKDMKAEVILDTKDHISEEAVRESATHLITEEAVLIVVRSGILKHSIPIAINQVPVTINQDIKAIKLNKKILPKYLAALFNSHQKVLLVEWRKAGATVESIEYDLLINTRICIPPIEEQYSIVAYLEQETGKIDRIITRIQESIKKLKEYGTALVSAAVTGKIDVRGEMRARSAVDVTV